MNPMHSADWITAFDWSGADARAHSEGDLSMRLLRVLPAREGLSDLADSPEATAFGRYTAALRHARGWSRTRLAEQARIDPLAVLLLEEAALTTQELSPGLVARLARAFDIPVSQLAVNPLPERPLIDAARPSFGRWLREQIAALAAGTGPLLAPQPRYRGLAEHGAEERMGAPPAPDLLRQPLPLPEQSLTTRDGRTLQASPTLTPTSPPQRGIADLLVLLRDTQGRPVPGINLELELEGLPFVGAAPSDAQGALRIPDLPLELLATLEQLDLRPI
jgi:transcriptional regulator with XRE-family HTH domain